MLGFHPDNSLLIIGISEKGVCAVRGDLVPLEDYRAFLPQLYGVMIRNRVDAVLLLGYGTHQQATPLLKETQDALESILTVTAVLRVHEGQWWSLHCDDPACCLPDGTPYDIASSPIAARATYAGLIALPDRAELAATLAPIEGADRDWMLAETERAEAELLRDGPRSPLLIEQGLALVRELIESQPPFTDRQLARLSVALTHPRVRDEAWVRMCDLSSQQQIRLWREVTRRAIGEYAAAPATLLAYAAYLSGDGALANLAVDRALQALPDYLAAALLQCCLRTGVPPQDMQVRFNPRTLAEAYGETTDQP
jgi:uncharacterized protein DUF4192